MRLGKMTKHMQSFLDLIWLVSMQTNLFIFSCSRFRLTLWEDFFSSRRQNLKESHRARLLKPQATHSHASLAQGISSHHPHVYPLGASLSIPPWSRKPVEWEEFVVDLSSWTASPYHEVLTLSEMIKSSRKGKTAGNTMVMPKVWQILCVPPFSQLLHLQTYWRLSSWNFLVVTHGAGKLWTQCFSPAGLQSPSSGQFSSLIHQTSCASLPCFCYSPLPVYLLWVTCHSFCTPKLQGAHVRSSKRPKVSLLCLRWVPPHSIFQGTSTFQRFF